LTETTESLIDLPEIDIQALPGSLRRGATHAGWHSLMPVQAKAIPYLLAGREMMIQARTGSGKTGAFVLPMLERIDPELSSCQALVLVPTRELAKQVWEVSKVLCQQTGIRTVAVYGGVGYKAQIDALSSGAQIVVGTPGRVLDHLIRGNLSLDKLKMRIFDEADRMLSMGFYPDMQEVQKHLPEVTLKSLHNSMFSATFPPFVMQTAKDFLRNPEFLSLSGEEVHVSDTEHSFYVVPPMDKDRALVRIIEIENPASAIIFCNTKTVVHYVTVVLQRFGYDADELSADRSQAERERVLSKIRTGNLRFLVATDVAARGLDIPQLSHVIQYEPPEDPESYVHRAGRTGRAGAAGVALSLVSESETLLLDGIAKRYSIEFQQQTAPSDAHVQSVVAERVTTLLEAQLRGRDRIKHERSNRFLPLVRSLVGNEDEAGLIAMLVDDYYQQSLHAPISSIKEEEKPSGKKKKVVRRKTDHQRSPPKNRR
tara:strand:- start:3177 stop:4628 length:1452 start_codon:yes stop_codon:yes gene_type:complete